jgi:hypothetical protein
VRGRAAREAVLEAFARAISAIDGDRATLYY